MQRLSSVLRRVYRVFQRAPRGFDLCFDLSKLMQPVVIFDVGANVGQSAEHYLSWFPDAEIYCFEPSRQSAAELRKRLNERVRLFEIAFSSHSGTARLAHTGTSDTFRIAEVGEEEITVHTVDEFCREHGIETIDFLKIDTEGHDLEVLKGAEAMLQQGKIAAVQVEAGMSPENDLHVPFDVFKQRLEAASYRLFGIYDQVQEWPTRQRHLRRANPVFLHESLLHDWDQ